MAGMEIYGIDPQELRIKQMLQQAAALRGQRAPQGQMVGSGQFQHYVAPSLGQNLAPLAGQIAGDVVENRAIGQAESNQTSNNAQIQQWIAQKPPEGDDAATLAWATAGLRQPGTRVLAQKILDDQIVQAPIRAERAADRKQTLLLTNQRYDEDRKARASLAAQQSADKLARLQLQLQSTALNQDARLQVQREIAAENQRLNQYRIDAGIDRADKDRESRERIAANTAEAKANAPVKMNSTQEKALSGLKDQYAELKTVVDSFKDEYAGGSAVLKNLVAPYGGIIPRGVYNAADPKNLDLTDWWRSYNKIGNFERHELFGSALTKVEQEAWKKQALPDTATPEQIRRSNQARMAILENALKRRGEGDWVGVGDTSAPPAPAPRRSALPRATGASSNSVAGPSSDDRINILLQERDKATGEDLNAINRELSRLGYKDTAPKAKLSDEELLNKYRSK